MRRQRWISGGEIAGGSCVAFSSRQKSYGNPRAFGSVFV
jgi:hypothetical protein